LATLLWLLDVWPVAGGGWQDFETLHALRGRTEAWRAGHPVSPLGLFFLAYRVVAAFSVPGNVEMNLAGRPLFGVFWGSVL